MIAHTSAPATTIPATNHREKRLARDAKRIDRLRVKRRAREWEVRITHEFITTWGHILHPQSFLLFTILEMFADWRPGPVQGHTNGYQRMADLIALSGLDKNCVHRSLMELEFYGLISFPKGRFGTRKKRGFCVDIIVSQETAPPKTDSRMQFQELNRLNSIVGAPTKGAERTHTRVRSAPIKGCGAHPH